MRGHVAVVTAAALLVAACGSSSGGTTVLSSTSAPSATSTVSTTSPPATAGTTTTVAPTTTVPSSIGGWLAVYRRDFPGYAVELRPVDDRPSIVVPLDRRYPGVWQVASDRAGGLVFQGGGAQNEELLWLVAGDSAPHSIGAIGTLAAVVLIEGEPTLLYVASTGESGLDGDTSWSEADVRLVAHRLSGGQETVAEGHLSARYGPQVAETLGTAPGDAAYGGGKLAILWTVGGECSRLELRDGLTGGEVTLPTVEIDWVCGSSWGGLLDIALSGDGETLFGLVSRSVAPELGGPDLVAWDLATGAELDRIPGTMLFVHDGDLTVAGDRRVSGTEVEHFVATLSEGVFDVTPVTDVDGMVLGVISDPLRLGADISLVSSDPWLTCSAAGWRGTLPAEPDLPEPVAGTRAGIAAAAKACDLAGMFDLAAVPADFRMVDADTACGDPWPMSVQDGDLVPIWYTGDVGLGELSVVLEALSTPSRVEGDTFVWEGEDGYRIEIRSDGAWVLDWRSFSRLPCETIWCTC